MASVLGGRFPPALLERMYALEPHPQTLDDALNELQTGGFVFPEDGEWRFTHDLLQEVAYSGLLLRIRKILHESAARLGEELYADRLASESPFFAHHYWEAGLRAEALPHLWVAGRGATERYDLPAAERHLRRAAEAMEAHADVLGGTEERARFFETLGKVLLWRGDLDGADMWFGHLEREADAAERPAWRARALELRGRVAWHRGLLDEAEALFESGLAILPPSEEGLAADLHNALGVVDYYRGRPDEAFAHHEEALRLREGLDDRLGMAKSHSNIGNLLLHFRLDFDGAEKRYRRALELAEEVGDRQQILAVVHNLGGLAFDRGVWAEALDWYGRAERLQEEVGWSHLQWVTILQQARCEVGLGRIGDAISRLEAARREGDAVLEPVNRVNVRLYFFDAWLCARADDRAEEALAEARRLVEELEVKELFDSLRVREGRLEVARGAWDAAARVFAEAEEAARRSENLELERLAAAHRARAEARARREKGSPGWLDDSAAQTPVRDPAEPYTYTDALIAYLLADADAARAPSDAVAERLSDVADRAAGLGSPALEQAALASLAKVHIARGDELAAREALDRTARATLILADGLPAELRSDFLAHPRVAL
jgi:tetratricopeptide (TPR) repeat protein